MQPTDREDTNAPYVSIPLGVVRPTTMASLIADLLEHGQLTSAEIAFKELVELVGLAGALSCVRKAG